MKQKRKLSIILGCIATVLLLAIGTVVGLQQSGVIHLPSIEDIKTSLHMQLAGINPSASEGSSDVGTEPSDTAQGTEDMSSLDAKETEETTEESTLPKLRQIKLSHIYLEMLPGDIQVLEVILQPEDSDFQGELIWESSDPEVASVEDGTVTALAGGMTKITVYAGDVYAVCEIIIKLPMTGIGFASEEITCNRDEGVDMPLQYYPEKTTDDRTAVWSSSDPEVASVASDGQITMLKGGETVITAQVGEFTASYVLHVEVPLDTVALSHDSLQLARGSSFQLILGYAPEDTTEDTTVVWSSSNPAVASVEGGMVTAHGVGSAVITAKIQDFTLSCEVTVNVPIQGLSINYPQLSLQEGQQALLVAEVVPADTTDSVGKITWSSSNPSVVSVDQNGVVTAIHAGTAQVTATMGSYSVTSNVSVIIPLESISFDRNSIDLVKGQTDRLTVSFHPANTTSSKQISWAVSNPAVITVTPDGLITAVGGGSAVVGATVDGITINCVVNVTSPLENIGIQGGNRTLQMGQSQTLTLVYNPADTTVNRTASWTSSNPAVASIDANGTVTALACGETVITANVSGVVTSCVVTVIEPVVGPQVTLVFDPGHGGAFVGSIQSHKGVTYVEKDMALKVALYTKEYLETHYQGVTIYMTRTSDVTLSSDVAQDLQLRCKVAADVGAAALISFHFNGSPQHTGYGATVLCSSVPSVTAQCQGIGNAVLAQLAALGLHNRGCTLTWWNEINADYYAINRHCANYGIPGIIIEHCFIDNATDLPYFSNDAALRRLAQADAIGIANYYGLAPK